ncbi:mannitol dehydrogenase family protein [Glutamicibacter nicotianae]
MGLRLDASAHTQLAEFSAASFRIPRYDVAAVRSATATGPSWVHFGAGNFFRSLHAVVAQEMLDNGYDKGIVLVNLRDPQVIERSRETDNYFVNAVLNEDGSIDPTLIASVTESLHLAPNNSASWERLAQIFSSPSLQLVTLTVTEKGYTTKAPDGTPLGDTMQGPANNAGPIPALASLMLKRFRAGAAPIALVSTDNFSENGDRLAHAVQDVAQTWIDAGLAPEEFGAYLKDPKVVGYPSTMVDRITPAPAQNVAEALSAMGLEQVQIHPRSTGGPLAPFSNTEVVSYLVLEDNFPNGRPPFERSSVILGDQETVNHADRMKVCTCLNPLHTAMAVTGCLLGYQLISTMMQDPDIKSLVHGIGSIEGLPVVDTPQGLDPVKFLDEVINKRLPNPGLPDSPQRIVADTSQKIGIRFGQTIARHAQAGNAAELRWIPFAIAAWLRYLLATDDQGQPFERSPDPLLASLDQRLAQINMRDLESLDAALLPLLSDTTIFHVDLVSVGLAPVILSNFKAMLAGPGSVRATLHGLANI